MLSFSFLKVGMDGRRGQLPEKEGRKENSRDRSEVYTTKLVISGSPLFAPFFFFAFSFFFKVSILGGFVIFALRIFLVLAKAVVVVVCDCGGRLRVCGEGLTAPASLPLLKARSFYIPFSVGHIYMSLCLCV